MSVKGIVTAVAVSGNPPGVAGYSVSMTGVLAREMMTAAHGVPSRPMSVRVIVSAHMAMRGSKSMEPVPAPGVGKAAESASVSAPNVGKAAEPASVPATTPAAEPTAVSAPASVSAPAATSMPAGHCRNVRDEAKRANRNARCQDSYRSLHGALLPKSKSSLSLQTLVSRLTPT